MKIILVRHGESEDNVSKKGIKDSPLTKKGMLQAEYLGKRLKREKIKIDNIYTSNLIRSKQTADIISKIIKVPVKESFEELNEYDDKDLKKRFGLIFKKRFWKLKKLIKNLAKNHDKDETVLLVAHGITNKIIIGYLMQIPIKKQLLRFRHQNTSLSVLKWNRDFKNWRLESMNDISHLPGKMIK